MKMLTKLVKEKKITKWNGWREIKLMNNLREEELGSKFGEAAKELRDNLHQAILHRRIYCSFEAAERMKHKWSKNISIKEALKLELTTGKLE